MVAAQLPPEYSQVSQKTDKQTDSKTDRNVTHTRTHMCCFFVHTSTASGADNNRGTPSPTGTSTTRGNNTEKALIHLQSQQTKDTKCLSVCLSVCLTSGADRDRARRRPHIAACILYPDRHLPSNISQRQHQPSSHLSTTPLAPSVKQRETQTQRDITLICACVCVCVCDGCRANRCSVQDQPPRHAHTTQTHSQPISQSFNQPFVSQASFHSYSR